VLVLLLESDRSLSCSLPLLATVANVLLVRSDGLEVRGILLLEPECVEELLGLMMMKPMRQGVWRNGWNETRISLSCYYVATGTKARLLVVLLRRHGRLLLDLFILDSLKWYGSRTIRSSEF
jgi:hypothetical protein